MIYVLFSQISKFNHPKITKTYNCNQQNNLLIRANLKTKFDKNNNQNKAINEAKQSVNSFLSNELDLISCQIWEGKIKNALSWYLGSRILKIT